MYTYNNRVTNTLWNCYIKIYTHTIFNENYIFIYNLRKFATRKYMYRKKGTKLKNEKEKKSVTYMNIST